MHRRIECALPPWHDTCCACSCLDVGPMVKLLAALLLPRSNFCHGKLRAGKSPASHDRVAGPARLRCSLSLRVLATLLQRYWDCQPILCGCLHLPAPILRAVLAAALFGSAWSSALWPAGQQQKAAARCAAGAAAAKSLLRRCLTAPCRLPCRTAWPSHRHCCTGTPKSPAGAYIATRSLLLRSGQNRPHSRHSLSMALTRR